MSGYSSPSKDFAIRRLARFFDMTLLLSMIALALTMAVSAPPARAADTPDAQSASLTLKAAREHIAGKRWQAAIDELKRVNARRDADWNNLMGYALRKQATPDLAGAESHYDAALRIDPKHLGALEYSGELYLMKGELAKAEGRLQALARACNGCEELEDLKEATARFKSAGNRYVPK